MSRRAPGFVGPRALAGLLALLALLPTAALSGCGSVPAEGPVEPPAIYPDQTAPELAFQSFLWAWNQGDLDTLERVLGGRMLNELKLKLREQEREAVAAWYLEDAQQLALSDVEWIDRGAALAKVRVVLRTQAKERVEMSFSLVERPDGWAVCYSDFIR